MGSAIFYIQVLKKNNSTVSLKIAQASSDGGFDINNHRDVLKAFAFGSDFIYPDGKKLFSHNLKKIITDDQLWDNDWLEKNHLNFYTSVSKLSQTNHPYNFPNKFNPLWIDLSDNYNNGYEYAQELFNCEDYPHCVVEITLAKEEFIDHLTEGLIYSFY